MFLAAVLRTSTWPTIMTNQESSIVAAPKSQTTSLFTSARSGDWLASQLGVKGNICKTEMEAVNTMKSGMGLRNETSTSDFLVGLVAGLVSWLTLHTRASYFGLWWGQSVLPLQRLVCWGLGIARGRRCQGWHSIDQHLGSVIKDPFHIISYHIISYLIISYRIIL